jgi:mRNA-degrading endonuclease RelE of RelBE toxin-antitoxin system
MYVLDVKPLASKTFDKLTKNNKTLLKIIHKKIQEIQHNPDHKYKFLRKPVQNINRVHIDKHFVLLFKIYHKEKVIEILNFNHHDQI